MLQQYLDDEEQVADVHKLLAEIHKGLADILLESTHTNWIIHWSNQQFQFESQQTKQTGMDPKLQPTQQVRCEKALEMSIQLCSDAHAHKDGQPNCASLWGILLHPVEIDG